MCGIFGYIGTNNLKIEKNILPHRGPDDWGVVNCQFGKKNITLFQSRLSIIGLGAQGHQPFQKYHISEKFPIRNFPDYFLNLIYLYLLRFAKHLEYLYLKPWLVESRLRAQIVLLCRKY